VVHVGLVGNLNYFEMLDFVLGFAGVDLCGDNGVLLGKWPDQTYEEAADAAWDFEDIRRQILQPPPPR